MDFIDYYKELGVKRDAPPEEIQKAYRKIARKYHPDVNKEAGAEDKFKRAAEAYEVLKDPDKRKKYDVLGSAYKNGGAGPGPTGQRQTAPPGYEDLFNMLNNQRRPGGGARRGPGGQQQATGFSDFFEAIFGRAQNPFGGGAGGGAPELDVDGVDVEAVLALGLEEAAAGGDREISLADPDTGRPRSLKVHIPKGVHGGQKIRLRGQGRRGSGEGARGDLMLIVEIKPHPRFRLEGEDLYTTLSVSPWTAALGGDATLKTLTGQVSVKVPAGSSSGRKIRLRGKGFPHGTAHGDLYAEVKIVVPETLSDKERALFESLAQTSKFVPADE
ncbi:MAG: J domain-containing protein [Myxococcota bacterium]